MKTMNPIKKRFLLIASAAYAVLWAMFCPKDSRWKRYGVRP